MPVFSVEKALQEHSAALQKQIFPGFGHALRPYYAFDDDYVPLNGGSFGACPKHVLNVYKMLIDAAERRPDTFLRVQYKPLLDKARSEVAHLVNCKVNDLVLLPNATTGVNAVLRGLNGTWAPNDAILVYETVYGACGKSAQYIVDSNPHCTGLQLVKVPLAYPLPHSEFLARTASAIEDAARRGVRIRIAVLDAISSLPGVRVPWEAACKLFRKHDILSLVDGAHSVGQIPLDLEKVDPDFFVSNCHKWMSAHRGVAFLYAPVRNQHLAPGIPTSHDYLSPNLPPPRGPPLIPTAAPSNWIAVWEWTGTQDLSNYLSIPAALEFRRWMGGEAAIIDHNIALARQGGVIVSSRLGNGSRVMEPTPPATANLSVAVENLSLDAKEIEGPLTAAMVNVSIPIARPNGEQDQLPFIAAKLQTQLTNNYNTFVPFYVHDNQIWIRISAQVWLETSDFHWLGDQLLLVLKDLNLLPTQ